MRDPSNTIHATKSGGRRRTLRLRAIVLAAMASSFWASAALAQHVAGDPKAEKPILQWVFLVVMVVICAGLAAWNAKRSHLG